MHGLIFETSIYDYWQDQPGLFITTGLNTGMTKAMPDMPSQVALCNRSRGVVGARSRLEGLRRLQPEGAQLKGCQLPQEAACYCWCEYCGAHVLPVGGLLYLVFPFVYP